MNQEDFIKKRDFLYHLTDKDNLAKIISEKKILSTETIVNRSSLEDTLKQAFLSERRKRHETIRIGTEIYKIRDQKPISVVNLVKCLTKGVSVSDFFRLLNSRVFFWPTLKRLQSHYNRYSHEHPVIIKVSTKEILELNKQVEFCRLNSGATRSNSYLNGAPPSRGEGTFLPAVDFKHSIGNVAEVTFPDYCVLPGILFIGDNPDGPWEEVRL